MFKHQAAPEDIRFEICQFLITEVSPVDDLHLPQERRLAGAICSWIIKDVNTDCSDFTYILSKHKHEN